MRFFVGHIAAEKLLHGRLFQHAAETQATPRKPADVAVREEAAFGAGATSCITLARPLRVFTKPHALAIKLGSIHTTLFHVHKHALFDEVTTKSVTTVARMITHFFGKIKGGCNPRNPPTGSASAYDKSGQNPPYLIFFMFLIFFKLTKLTVVLVRY